MKNSNNSREKCDSRYSLLNLNPKPQFTFLQKYVRKLPATKKVTSYHKKLLDSAVRPLCLVGSKHIKDAAWKRALYLTSLTFCKHQGSCTLRLKRIHFLSIPLCVLLSRIISYDQLALIVLKVTNKAGWDPFLVQTLWSEFQPPPDATICESLTWKKRIYFNSI